MPYSVPYLLLFVSYSNFNFLFSPFSIPYFTYFFFTFIFFQLLFFLLFLISSSISFYSLFLMLLSISTTSCLSILLSISTSFFLLLISHPLPSHTFLPPLASNTRIITRPIVSVFSLFSLTYLPQHQKACFVNTCKTVQ